ncbi:MAG: hypothetical protein ACYC8V_08650 [Caulobacteraceae bacterium]
MAAVTVGNGLEFYDFVSYALFAIDIGAPAFFMVTDGATHERAYLTTWAMDTLHMSPPVAFGRTVLATLIGIGSILLGGVLSDRFGRRPLMIRPTAAAILLAPLVFLAITSHPTMLRLCVVAGLLTKATGEPMVLGWYLTGALMIALTASLEMRESAPGRRLAANLVLSPAG